MKHCYNLFRTIGYVAGGIGLVLVLLGRKGIVSPQVLGAGVILLIVMACSFLVTYVIYVFARLTPKSAPPSRREADQEAGSDPENP